MNQNTMRSPGFDLAFIWVPFAIAVAAGVLGKALDSPLLVFTLLAWFFGYGHATALLGRLYLDPQTRKRHWFLAWALPIISIALTITLHKLNPIFVPAAFIFARFFHYTRQSNAFAKILGKQYASGFSHFAFIFTLPVILILLNLHPSQTFLGNELRLFEFKSYAPAWFAPNLLAIAATWILVRYRRTEDVSEKNYLAYLFTHVAIFAFGYASFHSLETGIVMLAAWHGAQYLMFVWHDGNRRSANSNDIYSRLFAENKIPLAVLALAVFTIAIYGTVKMADRIWLLNLTLIATMSINLHHYITEAFIWRR